MSNSMVYGGAIGGNAAMQIFFVLLQKIVLDSGHGTNCQELRLGIIWNDRHYRRR